MPSSGTFALWFLFILALIPLVLWLLKRSPVMLPIPGTGKVRHLEENTAAAAIQLSDEDFAALNGR